MKEFILKKGRGENALKLAWAAISTLSKDKPWRITIELYKNVRSLPQNRYLWGVANKLISEATGYELEEVHEYLCGTYFGWKDKKVPKTPRNPEGIDSVPVRTTTHDENGKRDVLKWDAFCEYVAFVQRFAAIKLHIVIPDPDKNYDLHREHAQHLEAA